MTSDGGFGPAGLSPDFRRAVEATRGLQPWRRIFHATNGVVLAWLPWALGLRVREVVLILAGVFTVLFLADVARLRWPRLNAAVFRALKPLITPREAAGFASSTWYTLGVLITYALFPLVVAIPAVLVLGLADPAASFVGRTFGRRPVGKGTLVGGAAFFTVALLVLLVTVATDGRTASAALATAIVVTGVELLPVPLDDNLTVPVATAAVLSLALLAV